MFFWGYIEDVKREIVTDFQVSRTPIEVNTKVSGGGPQFGLGYGHFLALTGSGVKAETSVSGGEVKVNSTRETIWTFDIGDTSFKLISDTMHLKNGDFVVVESYFRDGVYYIADCLDNATKKYSEPSWFPNYLEKKSIPQKPNILLIILLIISIISLLTTMLLFISGNIFYGIIGAVVFGVLFSIRSYKSDDYKIKLQDAIEQNNWIERHNAEYREYEGKICNALQNEGFLPKKEEIKQINS
ncbi:hypothetical protein OFN97_00615 [Campylobacter sp. VBCF_05 NA6]|uniref:hypothetical protein n=1 Tax=unclassified Campylobacter TaxID=2593542 RepID=UPI0022E9B63D|nr:MULTISPECIES: hypothetical protein [unclassified Campylobacter]MDA3057622.1 hypothetical protein [Campylobacter sp. VBCF_04 NA7]MDA3058523.1 hypothetical protein [Campylobacter sp. VBCF_05 NA6]